MMLDTNVLSEMMAVTPSQKVAAWIVGQVSDDLFTATVCQAEVFAGIGILPLGRRRTALGDAARAMFADDFQGRILPFDSRAAAAYGDLFASRRNAGRPTGTIDLMVAAIASVRDASVVTRNVRDFEGIGLRVIDPWTD